MSSSGNPADFESRRHRFDSFGTIAYGICGIDFDELFENVVGELA